jgi:hypothetical protein
MSQLPILLLITAKNCGACVSWKQSGKHQEIINKMNASGLVEVKDINLNKRGDPIPGAPEDLRKRLVKWYPIIILVSRSSWDAGHSLSAVVFNGIMNSKNAVPEVDEANYIPLEADNVYSWVNQQLGTNPTFHTSRFAVVRSSEASQEKSRSQRIPSPKKCTSIRYRSKHSQM